MIRSKFFAGLSPDITTKAKELGPVYTGIFMTTATLSYQESSSKFPDTTSVRRIMCSCGYEAASFDPSFNEYNPRCPKCGGVLLRPSRECSPENNFVGETANMRVNAAGDLEIVNLSVRLSPHIVNPTPLVAKTPEQEVENLKLMELNISETPLYTITKDKLGHMSICAHHGGSGNYIVIPLCDETKEFLGEDMIKALTNRNQQFQFEPSFFKAAQAFPEIFTPENLKKNSDGIKEVVELHQDSGTRGYDGSIIPKNATIEEFFEAKGYPVRLFPPNCYGRKKVIYNRDLYLKFLDTEVGKIVANRIANGMPFSCSAIDELVFLAVAKKLGHQAPPSVWRYHSFGGYGYGNISSPSIDGYEDLLLPFFKDAVDAYSGEDLAIIFAHRVAALRERGLAAPTEETVRTRAFSALENERKFISKKSVNISEDMSKNPLETLCSLTKRPPDTK